jgi:hypothetical protein
MSQKLQLLQRQMLRREQEQAPPPEGHGLGTAIEKLIADEVERRVGEAVERQPPARVQRLLDQQFAKPPMPTDYRQLPPVPAIKKPMPPITSTVTRRDHRGRILWFDSVAEGGSPVWRTEVLGRDELGCIRSLRTVLLDGPPLPADDAVLRTPRKIFGNDQE